jgi:hypothetical protein
MEGFELLMTVFAVWRTLNKLMQLHFTGHVPYSADPGNKNHNIDS